MISTRAAQLARRAAARGWRLERNTAAGMQPAGRGYRVTDEATGARVAATRAPGGYGLSLDEVEAALDGAV